MAVLEVSRQALRRTRIREALPTDHPAILDHIEALLDALPDPLDLGEDDLVGSLRITSRLRNRLDAYQVDLAGTADAMHVARSQHAGTTGTMVAAATGTNPAIGSAIVGTARALRTLPHVADAFRAGTITSLHVHALRNAAGRITDFAQIEQALVEVATSVDPAELRRILTLLIGQCHPEAPDADQKAQRDKRGLSLSETPGGMFRLDGWLDALEGRRLRDALSAFTDRGGAGDTRTPTQARADALADIICAANANTRPLGVSGLSVLVDIENLPEGIGATLDDGQLLGPEYFDLLSCTTACAVIFGVKRNDSFVPLALGRARRRASVAQWAALIARDRGCIRCGRSPRFCEAHHIVHWRHGGLTDLSNLVLMCSRCHHDLHNGHYTITMDTHGVPTITATRGPPHLSA
ncbi:MAG: DUF222 domain-containing protein [Candidatus Nanopelagicales bacterium]